jgi:uncharacterized protein
MKLQLANTSNLNTFTAYGEDYVSINGTRHHCNMIVLPDRLIPEWTSANFDSLTVADFEFLAGLEAEVILLGTGNQLRFPRPELMQPLIRAQKGLEVMDLQAACRIYNMLAAEGRKVAAGLLRA